MVRLSSLQGKTPRARPPIRLIGTGEKQQLSTIRGYRKQQPSGPTTVYDISSAGSRAIPKVHTPAPAVETSCGRWLLASGTRPLPTWTLAALPLLVLLVSVSVFHIL
jgi:hypothetical protein